MQTYNTLVCGFLAQLPCTPTRHNNRGMEECKRRRCELIAVWTNLKLKTCHLGTVGNILCHENTPCANNFVSCLHGLLLHFVMLWEPDIGWCSHLMLMNHFESNAGRRLHLRSFLEIVHVRWKLVYPVIFWTAGRIAEWLTTLNGLCESVQIGYATIHISYIVECRHPYHTTDSSYRQFMCIDGRK